MTITNVTFQTEQLCIEAGNKLTNDFSRVREVDFISFSCVNNE